MAIHVRLTNVATRKWKLLRKKFYQLASVVAVVSVIFAAMILYLVRIFSPVPPATQFTAYVENGEKMEEDASSESSAQDAVRQVQVTVQPVIVTTAPVDVSLAEVDIVLDADLLADTEFSMEVGMDVGDLGSGAGGLGGQGAGSGRGGSGRGKGGGGLGRNDDVQVVLVLDASGSMDSLFQAVASSLDELIGVLKTCDINGNKASVNVGIVVYGAARENGSPWQLSPFSLETEKMRAEVSGVVCDGGNEPFGEAIMFALKEYPWNMRNREQMLKVIFIAGNEHLTQGREDYRRAMSFAREKGVIVNTIHCGGENMEWKQAAKLGGGEGVLFDMSRARAHNPQANLEAERRRAENIAALYNLAILPLGSPGEQARHQEELKRRPPLPPVSNTQAVKEWARSNLQSLVRGYSWDAVELCRRLQGKCTIDSLGGRGNMPLSLRSKSDEDLLIHIQDLAQERSGIIAALQQVRSSGSFVDTMLNVLTRQAAERNITISP